MWALICLFLVPAAVMTSPYEDWQNSRRNIYAKLHQGCFRDSSESRDLPYLIRRSATENSVASCIRQCREQGFKFAGVQNAVDCYCGNNAVRQYDEAFDCGKACPGDSRYTCGGATSSNVYYVSSDDKYVGCYNDSSVQRDLPFFQWGASAGKSAADCIHSCSVKNYPYAGVQNGGACYCGDDFGRHGAADESTCNVRCESWARQNCGGDTVNAIYSTEIVGEMSSDDIHTMSTRLWDESGLISGIPTTLFTLYPALRTVLTKRLIIHTSSPVQTPIEDNICANNCYKTCGDIYQEDDLTSKGSDVTLRFFYVKLSQISSYVGEQAKRVFVYAQTVVIDKNVDFKFSLLIRTKQLFIDRSKAITINVATEGKPFDLDLKAHRFQDVEPNLLQQKMAFTCARILFDSTNEADKMLAYSVMNDIGYTRSQSKEVKALAGSIRSDLGMLTSVGRYDVHLVPFYTKDHLSKLLKTYYTEINIYRKNYDQLRNSLGNAKAFLDYAEAMHTTYTQTDVAEARVTYDSAITAVIRSNETYNRFGLYYTRSREVLEELRVEFEKGLDELLAWEIARACVKFITGIAGVVTGSISFDKDELSESVNPIIDDVSGLFDTMYNLANTVRQMDELSLIADKIIRDLEDLSGETDYMRHMDDIEYTAQLNVNIIKWRNMKNYGHSVLSNPKILRARGAANYHRQLMDVCNWGEALTRAMVEQAELLRGAMDARAILDAKVEQQKRVQEHIDDTRAGIIPSLELVLADMTEQTYDVRLDLNGALVVFCEAYFYENMFECRDSYKPSFGGTLSDLLIKINSASLDNLLTGSAPSTVEREIVIKDTNTASSCKDARNCPVNYLKQNRMLVFEVPQNHPTLLDLDAYKVAELKLNFTGVKTKDKKNPWLKIRIESSGKFIGRANGKIYHFLTRATSTTFEYNIITNHISVYADIAAPFRNIVQHVTPFTTWVMRISPERSPDIDFSEVTSVSVRFGGSAVDNETWKKRYAEAHLE